MAVNFDMLRSFMERWVGRNVNCRLIVTEQESSLRLRETEITQELLEP